MMELTSYERILNASELDEEFDGIAEGLLRRWIPSYDLDLQAEDVVTHRMEGVIEEPEDRELLWAELTKWAMRRFWGAAAHYIDREYVRRRDVDELVVGEMYEVRWTVPRGIDSQRWIIEGISAVELRGREIFHGGPIQHHTVAIENLVGVYVPEED